MSAGIRIILAISAIMVLCGENLPAYADIYRYVDKNGVMHFTNAPTSSLYKVYRRDSDYG
ncbi:MAG TPA: hypothetical protein DCQ37_14385, partial [Desulfobacteraceae bacterium]|nr:hypothetical protein [Desulfobacteraceae bacterium]